MPEPVPDPQPSEDASLNAKIVAEVTVSTASAIVTHPDDPYMVLVAKSAKHPDPVIPGGKIEIDDPMGAQDAPGQACVMREVEEEVGTQLLKARYIGQASDPERDVRVVPPGKVSSALTNPPFESINLQGVAEDQPCIRARYGTPDFIYVGTVDPAAVSETEELGELEFIDIRQLQPGGLSAGHDVIVLKYRDMLDSGADLLDEQALTDFEATRAGLILHDNVHSIPQEETISLNELNRRFNAARKSVSDFQFQGKVLGKDGDLSYREYRISYPPEADLVKLQVGIATSLDPSYSLNPEGLLPQSPSEVGAYAIAIEGFELPGCFVDGGEPVGKQSLIIVNASREQMDELFAFACAKERSLAFPARMKEVEQQARTLGLAVRRLRTQ